MSLEKLSDSELQQFAQRAFAHAVRAFGFKADPNKVIFVKDDEPGETFNHTCIWDDEQGSLIIAGFQVVTATLVYFGNLLIKEISVPEDSEPLLVLHLVSFQMSGGRRLQAP